MSPVYWKPKYPTRSMRERAFVKRQLAREEALKHVPREPLLACLKRTLRRITAAGPGSARRR